MNSEAFKGAKQMLKFEFNWNRKLAARGEATAPMLHDMLTAFVEGNFAGIDYRKFGGARHHLPTLNELLQIEPGTENQISGAYDDGTGRASFSIWSD
jgi:hypothetical protein